MQGQFNAFWRSDLSKNGGEENTTSNFFDYALEFIGQKIKKWQEADKKNIGLEPKKSKKGQIF